MAGCVVNVESRSVRAKSARPADRNSGGQLGADNDDFVLLANLEGPLVVRRGGEDLVLARGEAMLASCQDPMDVLRPKPGRLQCIRLPRSALTTFVPDPDACAGSRIGADNGALRVLMAYTSSIVNTNAVSYWPDKPLRGQSHL